ncbi:hypothetical protein MMC06_005179, partial [Schaereria dolodes]|nr:hypothetical protein [Schaereria dolodes]
TECPQEIFRRSGIDPTIYGWIDGDIVLDNKRVGEKLTEDSDGNQPYCIVYDYAFGDVAYGCVPTTGFNRAVLTTTSPAALPSGQDNVTTTSTSSSNTPVAPATVSATMAPMKMTAISGGSVAGAVIGSFVALIAILIIFIILRNRHLKKRHAAQMSSNVPDSSRSDQDRYLYPQYQKTVPGYLAPGKSNQNHYSDSEGSIL